MGNISLLDCNLRDGGYINNWHFGKEAIDFVIDRLDRSGIDMIEVGFLRNVEYDGDCTLFPDLESANSVLPKSGRHSMYAGMIDMGDPIDIDSIPPYREGGLDALRVIFKQDMLEKGYEYVRRLKPLGYRIMVQLVSTDTYTDDELADAVRRFSGLGPYAIYIVDTLGMMRREELMHLVGILDENMDKGIVLGYHSHNNLQQARGNAEAIVESGLDRDVMIDASVFGMGRGAGNLNEELFADYLNEYHSKNYRIEPMLEIVDRYLMDIYKDSFWGYSLPYYLSAKNRVHPNYAKFYAEKGTLTEKMFNELLRTISKEDSHVFSRETANRYYVDFMDNYIDDSESVSSLREELRGREVLVIAPGDNHIDQSDRIDDCIRKMDPVIISVGFVPANYGLDYVFCSNPKRYESIEDSGHRFLMTSNIRPREGCDAMMFNYSSYISEDQSQIDNAGITLIDLLRACSVRRIYLAGMDGYGFRSARNSYPDPRLSSDHEVEMFNEGVVRVLKRIRNDTELVFVTDSMYG